MSLADILSRPDVWRGAGAVAPAPALATGFAELDAELPGGGWPRGELTELLHEECGIGELSLLLPALAALTGGEEGQAVFFVAPPHAANAPAWVQSGIDPARLRWIHPGTPRDALWSAVEILRCKAVGACLLWMGPGEPLPANALRRLHLAAGEGGGVAILFRPLRVAEASSPATLRLQLEAGGTGLSVRVLKRRGAFLARRLELAVARPLRQRHALAGPGSLAGVPVPALA